MDNDSGCSGEADSSCGMSCYLCFPDCHLLCKSNSSDAAMA